MSRLAIAQNPVALAFDRMAKDYDNVFTRSRIGRAQRGAVWRVLTQVFKRGDHVLELNCGTGEDALFIAQHAISVTACDASKQMIQVASERLRVEAPEAPVEFKILSTERILELRPTKMFDGVFSNFSGLNCVANLKQTAEDLALLMRPNAPLLVCLSTRFCIWEMLWFFFHGKFRKAVRRCSGRTTVETAGLTFDVYYPAVFQLQKALSPYLALRSCMGVGLTVPPSYVENWISNYPKLLELLCAIDRRICTVPGLRVLGDHMLLRFERVGR